MSEKEKMIKGELYNPMTDSELINDRQKIKELCHKYNQIPPSKPDERKNFIKKIFGKTGENICVESNFFCDYGYNIEAGDNFYINHNCVILDCAKVKFGANVLIGPNCGFYTALHPLDVKTRNLWLESAKPISIGNNVWIGGNVTVLPGVTIGDNCVIGAGSVVVKDIPANSLAVGNPCKPVRNLI